MFGSKLILIPRQIAVLAIELYQWTLSPDHGWLRPLYPYGFCRFYPSCSQYGKVAIQKHGVIKGGAQALWRILRCNPWTHPSIEINN
jgi:putative membrane protein insertion efficiency factor